MRSKLALCLAATPLPAALAQNAPVPLPQDEGCAPYPAYNATTGIAGPWLVRAYRTTAGETLDERPISVASFTNDGLDRFGFVRFCNSLMLVVWDGGKASFAV